MMEVIKHMRDRVARTRKVLELAHNQEMVRLLKEMIEEAEADIRQLEAAAKVKGKDA